MLNGDPLATPPDELLGLVVEQTYLAGELALSDRDLVVAEDDGC